MNRLRRTSVLKSGDIVRARIGNPASLHTCIILENQSGSNHLSCMAICNFTGSPVGENMIDVSEYDLPWFDIKKTNTWVRCNEVDCIWPTQIERRWGNIKDKYPDLWSKVCRASFACKIAERLKEACDCEFDLIKREIAAERISEPECECEKPVQLF